MNTDLQIAGQGSHAAKLARAKRFINDRREHLIGEIVAFETFGGQRLVGLLLHSTGFGWVVRTHDGHQHDLDKGWGLQRASDEAKREYQWQYKLHHACLDQQGREIFVRSMIDYFVGLGKFEMANGLAYKRYLVDQWGMRPTAARKRLSRLRQVLAGLGVEIERDRRACGPKRK